jgi:hypothetical protein
MSKMTTARPAACLSATLLAVLIVLASPRSADAQLYEAVGTRAQGMGGAFVAVADDATASWWNPAGLANGAFLSLIFEHGSSDRPRVTTPIGPAQRDANTSFAVAFPSLGLSYYHLRISEIAPTSPTETQTGDRQDEGTVVRLSTVEITQFGSSVGQSIGSHLVLASTVKYVRAGRSLGSTISTDDPLGAAADLDVNTSGAGDFDLGALAILGNLRLGASVKHLLEPKFGDGDRLLLKRQARAGAAWRLSSPGVISEVTTALDIDLLENDTPTGNRRGLAGGIETWLKGKSLGVRGGFNISTVGDKRTVWSLGGSGSVRGKVHLNGTWLFGADKSRSGWSAGISMTY